MDEVRYCRTSASPELRAYGDESFYEHPAEGFYVLASVVFQPHVQDHVEELFLSLHGGRYSTKLHWNDLNNEQRRGVVTLLVEPEGMHFIVAGSPVPRRRQERARSRCLVQLVSDLRSFGVARLILEAREDPLNQRDIRTVGAHPTSHSPFRLEHRAGSTESLLWAADVLAGAYRSMKQGNAEYWEILASRTHDVVLDTRC